MTSNISVRVDADLKKAAEVLFNDMGLSMSAAINLFLRACVNNEKIPFEVKRSPNNMDNLALMAENDEIKEKLEKYESYHNIEGILDDIG